MRERSYTCDVVSLAPIGEVGDRLRNEGITVHSCEGRGGWDFFVISRLAQIISQANPKIVHSMLFHANLAARRAARKIGLPASRVICEIQTVEIERRWHLMVDRWTHKGCRFTIGNSPSVVDHLANSAGISRDRLRLVRGGIDPEAFQELEPIPRQELALPNGVGLTDEDRIVLWVGRLDPVKGLSTLIEAFGDVANTIPAYLLLVGDGPQRGELEITDVNLRFFDGADRLDDELQVALVALDASLEADEPAFGQGVEH